jgi:hypothetical protein
MGSGEMKMTIIKRISTVLLLAGAGLLAAANPDGVPKGATETAPGVYRFVDKDGKAWLYRKTPFGIQKSAEKDAKESEKNADASGERSRMTPFGKTSAEAKASPAREKSEAAPNSAVRTKVTEDGDNIHFERPTPFGMSRWSRKKDELTTEEKRLWEDHRAAAAGNDSK